MDENLAASLADEDINPAALYGPDFINQGSHQLRRGNPSLAERLGLIQCLSNQDLKSRLVYCKGVLS